MPLRRYDTASFLKQAASSLATLRTDNHYEESPACLRLTSHNRQERSTDGTPFLFFERSRY